MPSQNIEQDLLGKEKREHYRTRLLQSIRVGQAFSQKSADLKVSGGKPTPDALQQIVHSISSQLTAARDSFVTGKLPVRSAVEKFRQATHEEQWPTVIIEINKTGKLKQVSSLVEQSGFTLAPDAFGGQGEAWKKFELFRFLHVRIPPDPAFLEYLSLQPFSGYVFDAERIVSLPKPILMKGNQRVDLKMRDARSLVLSPKDLPGDVPENLGWDVRIAIVDSGIDTDHPDFNGKIQAIQNFSNEADAQDTNGHGTHVAGIAAGRGTASDGQFTGISPESDLIIAKVFNASGTAETTQILSGMRWAWEQGAQVMNLSLGNSGMPTDGKSLLSRACDILAEQGVVVCVSAGNSGPGYGTVTAPGDARNAICVGAVNKQLELADFSSRGPTAAPDQTGNKPDIVAPGVNIISARSRYGNMPPVDGPGFYTALSGTSMSTPVVSGICALVISYSRFLQVQATPESIKSLLQQTAFSLDYEPHEEGSGFVQGGRVLSALAAEKPNDRKPFERKTDVQSNYIDRYKILEKLGSGGSGIVLKVYDTALQKEMAAKIYTDSEINFDKGLAEARKQKRIDHPAIIRVENVVELSDDRYAIIMEYAEGGTLEQQLERGPLPLEKCLPYMESLLDGMCVAHAENLLHYDIKPVNILFSKDGHIKIADFGASRLMERTGDQMSRIVGTLIYMGPEQMAGKEDKRSDIWSLGALFYEMLTGRRCFDGGSTSEIRMNILDGKYPPILSVNRDVPEAVAGIVDKMLRVRVEKRFQSMADVKKAIAQYRTETKLSPRRLSLPLTLFLSMVIALIFMAAGGFYASRMGWIQFRPPFPMAAETTAALPPDISSLPVTKQLDRAKDAIRSGDYILAYHIFDAVETRSPDGLLKDRVAFEKASLLADQMNDPDGAIAAANLFIQRYPDSPKAGDFHYLLGQVYFEKKDDLLKAVDHLSILQKRFPNSPRIQTVDYLLKKARMRLNEKGPSIGLVRSDIWGGFLPNNWMSLLISFSGFAASFIGILAWIVLGRHPISTDRQTGFFGSYRMLMNNKVLFLNIFILFLSQLAAWWITQYQSQETYRQIEAQLKSMIG